MRKWLGRTSPEWPVLYQAGCKPLISQINTPSLWCGYLQTKPQKYITELSVIKTWTTRCLLLLWFSNWRRSCGDSVWRWIAICRQSAVFHHAAVSKLPVSTTSTGSLATRLQQSSDPLFLQAFVNPAYWWIRRCTDWPGRPFSTFSGHLTA